MAAAQARNLILEKSLRKFYILSRDKEQKCVHQLAKPPMPKITFIQSYYSARIILGLVIQSYSSARIILALEYD